jgi:triacylglycerol lipase
MPVPRLRVPIVLVHGLFGFDRLKVGGWVLANYFAGIPDALTAAGNRVIVPRLSPTGGIAERAAQLKEILDRESPHEPVHLFGHSMGGLDARYFIAHLGGASRVLTLTTLGTPHRGSSFADWALPRLGRLISPLFDFLGLPRKAFDDLTVTRCKQFNEQTPDAPGVRYFSVAGRFQPTWLTPEWQLPASILQKAEGDNDGVVSIRSASYGESCTVWEGDHMNLVNWLHPWVRPDKQCDRLNDYAALVGRLADEGF